MGCRNRLDLLNHIKSGNVPKLPLLSKMYILYNPKRKIPLQESLDVIKKLKKNIKNIKKIKKINEKNIIPVGSIRREERVNTDIDLLLVVKELKYIDLSGNNLTLVEGGRSNGKYPRHQKYIFKIGCKNYLIDIFICVKKELPFMLFHYTGSKLYNIRTRFYAKKKGWLLNQYGLWHKSGNNKLKIKIKTEKDLIQFLGISYKKPVDRIK